ncbi:MAG: peptide chain release factor 1 [Alteromonas naphthalenivorans]|jgi:peptide chain release factor 1
MAVKWDAIQARFDELAEKLSGLVDSKERPKIQKEHSQLFSLLEKHRAVEVVEKEITDTKTQSVENTDQEMQELYELELEDLQGQKNYLKSELDNVMFPPNPFDKKDVFLEVRAGAGGKEAALFAGDLLKMYTNYALSKGWRAEIASLHQTDLGGIKEVVLNIQGRNIYGYLKFESGVHRVQRVPETESAGRVHTSTATVAVLPEVDEVDVTISPDQLRIDVYRASGAGGQHVNTTDSAVRITHLPSGVVVTCQDERSQHKNKAKAMKMLRSRLVTAHQEKKDSEMSEQRRELVGTGMRAEKVRTYNYPQNRITDHQVGLTLKKLDVIMTGQLDEIVVALQEHDKEERRKKPFKFS